MILYIIEWLTQSLDWNIPTVFTYYSTRMISAAMTALFLTIFLGPFFIGKLRAFKIGQSIRNADEGCAKLGELHQGKQNNPTMGGVLILFAMLVSMLLWMDLSHVFTLILCVSTLILGFIGGWDDYLKVKHRSSKGLSGKKKLFGQCCVGALIACYMLVPQVHESLQHGAWFAPPLIKESHNPKTLSQEEVSFAETEASSNLGRKIPLSDYASRIYFPFFKEPILKLSGIATLLAGLLILFTVTASSNAVNLTDGLDGLATGCLIMVAASLALIAFLSNHIELAHYLNILYIEGSGEIAIYLSAFLGACLGFLWYNGHPAEVFMGDTGSLALGGIIGVAAVLLRREFLLALVGGVFVIETLSVMIQVASYKLRNKKRVFLCAPLHHHFEYKGWAETKVVIRFWIVGLVLAVLGVASLKFQ